MVECLPLTTLMVGSSVSQWAETTRMAVGRRGKTFCCQDLRKCLAGRESSIDSVGDPWDMKKVSMTSPTELDSVGDGGGSKGALKCLWAEEEEEERQSPNGWMNLLKPTQLRPIYPRPQRWLPLRRLPSRHVPIPTGSLQNIIIFNIIIIVYIIY